MNFFRRVKSSSICALMEKVYREIGARIRSLRQTLKLTQAEVAERVGIDASFYGQVERGSNIPSLRTLFAVAHALRVEPASLLPKTRGRPEDDAAAEALGPLLSRLKPGKRRFLMGVVRDLAGELELRPHAASQTRKRRAKKT